MSGMARTIPRFPAAARASSPVSPACCRVPAFVHPIDQLDVQTSTFIPTGPKTSLFFAGLGWNHISRHCRPIPGFTLGGAFRLGAYLPQEFVGNHYAYSSFGFRREFYHLPQLVGGKIYWGGWYEAGSAFNDPTRSWSAAHSISE